MKLKELEKRLEDLMKEHRQQTIYVETLHMYEPKVEQLSYHLGQLDIRELSGSLNLGNNFGTASTAGLLLGKQRKPDEPSEKKPKGESPEPSLQKSEEINKQGQWQRKGPGICYEWKE